jgi:CAAX prenyl protease-like protein
MNLRDFRSSPGAAWAGPLLIFMVFKFASDTVRSEASNAPWYWAHPEQWIYPVQTLVTLALVGFWWRHYTFQPLGIRNVLLALVAGTVGIALWILPSWLYERGAVAQNEWLGFVSRAGDHTSFDPSIWESSPGVYWSVVGMRLLRMTVAVAFAEELFWRGFLWRIVSDPYRDFHKVPFAQPSWKALGAVVLLFTFSHGKPDWFAAVIYGLIISGLYRMTKSVGACVIAHAVSNLVLGIYVMKTRQWGFW